MDSMTEGAVILLRILLWIAPGIAGFLAVRGLLYRRSRVALGMLVAGVVLALLTKPIIAGFLFLLLGALAGLGGRRKSAGYWLEQERLSQEKRSKRSP